MNNFKSYFIEKKGIKTLNKKSKDKVKKNVSREESEESENFDSPYLDQGGQNTPNSVYAYPGWGIEGRSVNSKTGTFSEMMDMTIGTSRPDTGKLIVVYPGKFQLFHLKHAAIFNKLKEMFPEAMIHIATTNEIRKDEQPFDYEDKLQMMVASGINPNDVVKTGQPYSAPELVNKYDKDATKIIFVVGKQDIKGPNAKFMFGKKKDGKPSYHKIFKDKESIEPISKHIYVMPLPKVEYNRNDTNVKTSREIRETFKRSNENQRKQIIVDLYGKFKPEIYKLFTSNLY